MSAPQAKDTEGHERLVTVKQVIDQLSIGRSTWWLWVSQGKAPAPVKLSGRITRWRQSDINSFISDQN